LRKIAKSGLKLQIMAKNDIHLQKYESNTNEKVALNFKNKPHKIAKVA
jgi:hypothetical protein